MMGSWGDMGWLGMGVGMLIWAIVLVIVVWLVVRGLMAVERRDRSTEPGDSSEQLLRRRFAAGEIDAEEYERRLVALRG
jgi:putative membrane protein